MRIPDPDPYNRKYKLGIFWICRSRTTQLHSLLSVPNIYLASCAISFSQWLFSLCFALKKNLGLWLSEQIGTLRLRTRNNDSIFWPWGEEKMPQWICYFCWPHPFPGRASHCWEKPASSPRGKNRGSTSSSLPARMPTYIPGTYTPVLHTSNQCCNSWINFFSHPYRLYHFFCIQNQIWIRIRKAFKEHIRRLVLPLFILVDVSIYLKRQLKNT